MIRDLSNKIFPTLEGMDHQYIGSNQTTTLRITRTLVNNKNRRLHPITIVIQYIIHLILPLVRNTVDQLIVNDHLQDMSGFVFHFCIRLQIAMSNGFNPSAPRIASAEEHAQPCDCLCFVLVCCYGKFRSH